MPISISYQTIFTSRSGRFMMRKFIESRIIRTSLFFAIFWLIVNYSLFGQEKKIDQNPYESTYTKQEVYIEMRDGVKLFTSIYTPINQNKSYPFMLSRTPYSVRPYGEDTFKTNLGRNDWMEADGYIWVFQDVRGRWMSEGLYTNMTPHIPGKTMPKEVDESSDTYDTIEWLLNNVENNNGRVGQKGISYPGFYTAAGMVEGHPALLASSPQAPIADFFFDDFHHNGAFLQSYWVAVALFGYQKDGPQSESWYKSVNPQTPDGYQFYMDLGPLKNASRYYGEDNEFWTQLVEHPNYDEFWQKRSIIPHLHSVDHHVLTVGGLFDAEDLYGPLTIYKTVEKEAPALSNRIIMGPWSHGDWARERGAQQVGYIHFGDSISTWFQKNIEAPFFRSVLIEGTEPNLPEATIFDTGTKQWLEFNAWPPKEAKKMNLFFGENEGLTVNSQVESSDSSFDSFISDPKKPVPYTEETRMVFTPRKYMTDDQRFAARRPDVLVYETPVLENDLTIAGEVLAELFVSTTESAADWIVKIVDVFPPDAAKNPHAPAHIEMGNFHMMVRSEVMRGRFRNSFEKPEAFVSNKPTKVAFALQDVMHTFKKGHKLHIQVQSTWFPLIDRNPQKYVPNIYKADESDFVKAEHRVYRNAKYPSKITVDVLDKR